MSTFVLVHGAWHGGWCWHKVAPLLEKMGHRVLAPDMPGHGADTTPIESVTLDDIVARIHDTIDGAGEKVVLAGHSYGGAVITQAAERRADKVKHLVYLAAFLLDNGQCVMDLAREDRDNKLNGKVIMSDDEVTATVEPSALRECFYGDCSDADIDYARARLSREATAGFNTPMRTTAANFGRLPRSYIECIKDGAISIGLQRRMHAALPARVFTLGTDHSPFFSAPEALADILAGLG